MSIGNEGMGMGVGGYIQSERVEYALTNDAAEVTLSFPSMFEQKISQLRNRCMKIDHVVLEYRSQVPINAVGHVVIEIHDMRLTEGDTKQAEFTIPIKCNCNLHYYSSSFFSIKDKNPWRVEYRVENTNVVNGVHFCKMLGKLKLSSAKHSTDVEFRPPKIEIQTKEFTVNDIDFWSVGSKPQTRRLVDGSRLMGHSKIVTGTLSGYRSERIMGKQIGDRTFVRHQQTIQKPKRIGRFGNRSRSVSFTGREYYEGRDCGYNYEDSGTMYKIKCKCSSFKGHLNKFVVKFIHK
uniref:Movement protein BC1 n=1 Tax=Tomato leaf curl New Delhi virus TaxID=223347 RepID=A0A2P2CL12_9GEMI|nr:movement protein [Tomato leaf curl New Delhi virus]